MASLVFGPHHGRLVFESGDGGVHVALHGTSAFHLSSEDILQLRAWLHPVVSSGARETLPLSRLFASTNTLPEKSAERDRSLEPSQAPVPSKVHEKPETYDVRNHDDLLTTEEAAKLLKVSPGGLENMRSYGRGPKYIKIGGRVRYRRRDLTHPPEALPDDLRRRPSRR